MSAAVDLQDVFNLVQTPQHLLFVLPYFYTGLELELSVLYLSVILKVDHTIELLVKCDELKDEDGEIEDKLLVKNKKRETPFFLLNKLHGELRRDFKYLRLKAYKYENGIAYLFTRDALHYLMVIQLRKMFLMNQGRQIKTQKKRNKKMNKTTKNY